MISCKKCGTKDVVKSGKVRGKQRYQCKKCGYHFVRGDARKEGTTDLKALSVLLSALCKGKYQEIGEWLYRDRAQIYRWAKEAELEKSPTNKSDETFTYCKNGDEIKRYLDEHDIFRATRPVTVIKGKVANGFSVIVIVQQPKNI